MSTKVLTVAYLRQEREDRYQELEELIAERVASLHGPLFVAYDHDPSSQDRAGGRSYPYFYVYGNLPEDRKQVYNCNACRRFLDIYGSLVSISATGDLVPALLDPEEVPPLFREGFRIASQILRKRGRVNGVFVSTAEVWGQPETGDWTHLHGRPDRSLVYSGTPAEAGQRRAGLKQDYILLRQSLADFSADLVYQASSLLRNGTLPRAEKSLEMPHWLLELLDRLKTVRGPRYDNLVWLATATAPSGFSHFCNTVLGALLDDLKSGRDSETLRRNWSAKLDPLQYQRPKALKEGQLLRAEKVIAELKAAGSLQRRFATADDVLSWAWRPTDALPLNPPEGSVFGHLKPKRGDLPDYLGRNPQPGEGVLHAPISTTWVKFRDMVLTEEKDPVASLDVLAPSCRASFYSLVTAADPTSPPLLQWDGLRAVGDTHDLPRNPVSWYMHYHGNHASEYGLAPGSWVRVSGVFGNPAHWQKPEQFRHQAQLAFFALEGCYDLKYAQGGGLFPESLRAEFREVRAALEAYANSTPVARIGEANDGKGTVNGIAIQSGVPSDLTVRARRRRGAVEVYKIDRWD